MSKLTNIRPDETVTLNNGRTGVRGFVNIGGQRREAIAEIGRNGHTTRVIRAMGTGARATWVPVAVGLFQCQF